MTGTPNDDRTVMIADMRKTMTVLQISKELGISRTIIYYHLRKDAWMRAREILDREEAQRDEIYREKVVDSETLPE